MKEFEVTMPTAEQGAGYREIGDTGWVSVNINHDGKSLDRQTLVRAVEAPRYRKPEQTSFHLFEGTAESGITFSERFPRLTVAVIALALVAFTVATEVEYLRVSGYYWR